MGGNGTQWEGVELNGSEWNSMGGNGTPWDDEVPAHGTTPTPRGTPGGTPKLRGRGGDPKTPGEGGGPCGRGWDPMGGNGTQWERMELNGRE